MYYCKQQIKKERVKSKGILTINVFNMMIRALGKILKSFPTMKKQITASVLSVCMIVGMISMMPITAFAEDNNTSGYWTDEGIRATSFSECDVNNKTITINNEAELGLLAYNVSLSDTKENYEGYTITLAKDLDLSAHRWIPIGQCFGEYFEDEVIFSGRFNGDSHTISGVNIDSQNAVVGLFGIISNSSEIENLGVINSYVNSTSHVGGVCGMNNGTITNCYNTGSIEGDYYVGGVCGYNEGAITNCYNTSSVKGSSNIGGVCGNNDGTIINCYNTGAIDGIDYVGGVCGYNDGTITNCYNTGAVKGENFVGGVCADNFGTITNSYNAGNITGLDYVGGMSGGNSSIITNCYFIDNPSYKGVGLGTDDTISFSNDENYTLSKAVDVNGTSTTSLLEALNGWVKENNMNNEYKLWHKSKDALELILSSYWTDEGIRATEFSECDVNNKTITINNEAELGLLAYNVSLSDTKENYEGYTITLSKDLDLSAHRWTPIGQCFGGNFEDEVMFSGRFNGDSHTISGVNIDSKNAMVGLFGIISNSSKIENLGVINSYVKSLENYCGGVCGKNYGTITNCYNTGSIEGREYVGGVCGVNNCISINCYNFGLVKGSTRVGGMCGWNIDAIKNFYNNGDVKGSSSVGGVCGYNYHYGTTITNSYFIDTTGCKGVGSGADNTISFINDENNTLSKSVDVNGVSTTSLLEALNLGAFAYQTNPPTLNKWENKNSYPVLSSELAVLTLSKSEFEFTAPSNLIFDNTPKIAKVEPKDGINCGQISVNYYDEAGKKLSSAPINAGRYTVKIDVEANNIYDEASEIEVGTFTISPKAIQKIDINIQGIENQIYTSNQVTPSLVVSYGNISFKENTDYKVCYGENTNIGKGSVTLEFIGNYSGKLTYEFDIDYGSATSDMYFMGKPNAKGWYNKNIIVSAKTGYKISKTVNGTYDNNIIFEDETDKGIKDIYLKANDGKVYKTTINYKLDKTVPEGSIRFNENPVKKLLNNIAFRLFFIEDVFVTITSQDKLSDILKTEYVKSASILTETEVKNLTGWKVYNNKFGITSVDKEKFIIYVKATDNAGNEIYFGSDGSTFDTARPTIDAINGKIYCKDVLVTVTDDNLDTVTLDGNKIDLKEGKAIFTVSHKEGEQTIVAKDKAGNKIESTITVNNGHTPEDDDGDCTTPVKCKYCKEIVVEAQEHDFTGKWQKDANYHWHECTH